MDLIEENIPTGMIAKNNPTELSQQDQMIYFGQTQEARAFDDDYVGDVPAGHEEFTLPQINPYTNETKKIRKIRPLIVPIPQQIIDDRVTQLKTKVALGTASTQDREDLSLLVG